MFSIFQRIQLSFTEQIRVVEFITHYPTFTAKLLVQLNIVTDATNSSRIVVDINQIIRIRRKVRNISKRNIKKRETFKKDN